jgi:hypothetical protein
LRKPTYDALFALFGEVIAEVCLEEGFLRVFKADNGFVSGFVAGFLGFNERDCALGLKQSLTPLGEIRLMQYRYVATTLGGFIQQLAVCYVGRGYWFYVPGVVPEGVEPESVDEKLLTKYQIAVSKFERARRKRAGLANLQYLRWGRKFLLLATEGKHPFFAEEASLIKDVRKHPLVVEGYAIGYANGRVRVSLSHETYEGLKSYCLENATHKEARWLTEVIRQVGFEPYAQVRYGLFSILTAINKKRQAAGLPLVPEDCVRRKRKIYRPFASPPLPSAQCGAPRRTGADTRQGRQAK